MLPFDKMMAPQFECVVPSTKQTVKFRPYLVKEEKVLLIAKESNDARQIYNAVKQIVQNCVLDQITVDDLPSVDLEYLFLKIHSKTLSNISKLAFRDQEDDTLYKFEVDLDTVEVIETEGHTDKIAINNELGMVMRYPTVKMVEALESDNEVDLGYELTRVCISVVYDEETVYPFSENSTKEQIEFVENLSVDAYEKVQEFFRTIPKLEYELAYTNSLGTEKKIVLRGLTDFFSWG